MKRISIDKNEKLAVLILILIGVIIAYLGLLFLNYASLKKYNNIILPNSFIEGIELSNNTYLNAGDIIDYHSDFVLSKKVKFKINDNEYEYSLKDLGVVVDKDKTLNNIKNSQKKLSITKKISSINGKRRNDYSFYYSINNDQLVNYLNVIKSSVDVAVVNGYFDTSEGVKYVSGIRGFSLDVNKSIDIITDVFSNNYDFKKTIELTGDYTEPYGNPSYSSIDTLTSSFETPFVPDTYLRNINLNVALGYINGSVVEPGEVFSYCNKAGPFNKAGYVFYYEFVGNGVCQIATTTYNAALLGGLEIVKRYPHKKRSLYVAGGLDATVASYSGGWCVDMQFRNTYKYPIYIKAYSVGSTAHVEFWSNHDAKEGKEYTTESVRIGQRGYRTFLHTFKDGVEIDKHEIVTTWYSED